ncbi:MAG: asparaginase [Candidatus Thorarchaeota archaeon]|nr:MAG: asparaginase [Candidatus Thorarchaeota archaeon]
MAEGGSRRICIMTTGGTISSVYDSEIGAYRPGMSIEGLLSGLPKDMGEIEVVTRDLFQLDSANAQPHHWIEIADAIKTITKEDSDIHGFVVLHGTDTMVYSAAAVSFMAQGLGRPVAFTGSQIPASVPWSDGPRNLRDAIRVAAWADLGETCIVFNGEIHRATRARKLRERAHDAFDSVDPTPLGLLGRDIVLYENRMRRTSPKPKFKMHLDEEVFLLKVFPGMKPSVITKIVDLGYHGIVIEGFGSGNIPTRENALGGVIKEALERGCTVLMSTQCPFGQADLSLYEVGKAALKVGALSAYDMTSEAAFVKLMWSLGQTDDLSEIAEIIHTNIVGEITMSPGAGMRGT